MRKSLIAVMLAALATPALADPPPWAPAHGYRDKQDRHYEREYDRNGRYSEPRRIREDERVWRGRDGRYYCRRGNGTTGLIIGGAAGALVGREIDGGHNRTAGTLLGAAGGALLGREIDRGGSARCR